MPRFHLLSGGVMSISKRNFLKPVSIAIATLLTSTLSASHVEAATEVVLNNAIEHVQAAQTESKAEPEQPVLAPSEAQPTNLQHRSHMSHSSHSSHSSHRSHYSGFMP